MRGIRALRRSTVWGFLIGLLCLGLAPAAAAAPGWARAFHLAGPATLDVSAPRVAIAASGTIAVAYSLYDEDNPANSQAYLVTRSPGGRVAAPKPLSGAQQIMDLAYSRSTLEVLLGGSPRGQTCCSYARAVAVAGGGIGRQRTVADGLTGFTLGRLIALGEGRLLAAVATERGVWAAQSDPSDRFGPSRKLTPRQRTPWMMAVTVLPSAQTFIGWAGAGVQAGGPGPTALMVAQGSASAVPRDSRTVLTVARGHQLEELALAPGGSSTAVAAWIESWFAADGSYRSEPVVADLAGRPRGRPFPIPGSVASGITAAGDGSGQQVVAWKTCGSAGPCSVWATFRRAGGRFGSALRLGSIDTGQAPAAAFGNGGRAVVGWVAGWRVMAADRGRRSSGFSPPRAIPTSSISHDLSLAVTPSGSVLGVWTEGTLNPSVVGAVYRFQ